MAVAVRIPVTIPCDMCGGRPFVVTVPMRSESVNGALQVLIDDEHLVTAVRMHLRQHQN